jgi:hypothetical protein
LLSHFLNITASNPCFPFYLVTEEANRKIASYEKCNNEEDPFQSDVEPITASEEGESGNIFMKIADDLENYSNLRLDDPCLEKELEEFRIALIESINARGGVADTEMSNSCDSEKMVNVRMIDAENFQTEWDVISPLPPPPDHGLRSPIVQAILSRWTDDPGTQSALIRWVEDLLSGMSVDDAPPLKISSLDHQLKEGFIYHVLPLLLRRKDIHVEVTSRATRTTSYELAVSISRPAEGLHDQKSVNESPALLAFRATCNGSVNDDSKVTEKLSGSSLACREDNFPGLVKSSSNAGSISTAITSNRTPTKATSPLNTRFMSHYPAAEGNSNNTSFPDEPELPIMAGASPSLVDDLSVESSMDEDETSNYEQGLRQSSMTNWSGAFRLLTRKKLPASSPRSRPASNSNSGSPTSLFLTPQRQSAPGISSYEEEQPYHRVVTAPPGKIGITFVDYRGHCIVSQVAQTSPLASYVHRTCSHEIVEILRRVLIIFPALIIIGVVHSIGHLDCH